MYRNPLDLVQPFQPNTKSSKTQPYKIMSLIGNFALKVVNKCFVFRCKFPIWFVIVTIPQILPRFAWTRPILLNKIFTIQQKYQSPTMYLIKTVNVLLYSYKLCDILLWKMFYKWLMSMNVKFEIQIYRHKIAEKK